MDYTELKKIMSDPIKWAEICEKTKFLDAHYVNIPARQRLWHIENNSFDLVSCKICKKHGIGFSNKSKTYSTYCNISCGAKDPDLRSKTVATCMVKFGAKSNLCLKENKAKEEATKVKKYGVKNYLQTAEGREKYKSTCLQKYGVVDPNKLQSVKDKVNQTNFEKYGRKRSSQAHIPSDIVNLKNDAAEMNRWFFDLKMPVSEIAEVLGINASQLCVHFRDNLNIDISRHAVSTLERQLGEFLCSLQVKFTTSDRNILKPKELDIVIPDRKIAIEINGLAWHSELKGKNKTYHLDKTRGCAVAGYRLVHIWSSEWILNKDLVKSRLKSILGFNQKIMARKCTVIEVTATDTMRFLKENHIQGYCQSKIRYGLINNGELVAIMTFGKSRFNKSAEWELLRYCSKQGVNIVGGASKLFAQFTKLHNPTSTISYCDLRWNTGELYQNLGFTKITNSGPNQWITKDYSNLESRLRYQKHKLAKILPEFDSNKTAWDNMVYHGYDRVWDCGNSVWLWLK